MMTRDLSILLSFVLLLVVFASCDTSTKPYINFELKADQVDDDCSKASEQWTVDANTAGERYTFDACLQKDYDVKLATMEHKGDTVVLHFNENLSDANEQSHSTVGYKLTLDVDAYPKYKHLQLGDRIIDITVDGN